MSADIKLRNAIEAVLFTASEPLSLSALAELTDRSVDEVQTTLDELKQHLTGGIRLAANSGDYRLVTDPEAASIVGKFVAEANRQDLSRPALEALSIVAYRGPITKSQIDAIRGVSSEAMLRNLLARDLIQETGRSSEPGRPQQYSVSHNFLQHFGLTSAADLPPLPDSSHEN